MNTFVLKSLMEERGISVAKFAEDMNVAITTVYGWLDGAKPRIGTAQQIAEYFGVPLARLMEKPKDKSPEYSPIITEDEMRVVAQYRQLTAENREKAREYMEFLQMKQPKEKTQVS